MKLKIICIGKSKRGYLSHGIKDYLTRLKHYTSMEWIELQPAPKPKVSQCEVRVEQESERIRKHIHASAVTVALSEGGKEFSSLDFAGWLERQMIEGKQEIVFIIGGDQGLSPSILSDAQLCLSLSRMTLTHQMARLILLEQIYRAFTIIRGEPYHHG